MCSVKYLIHFLEWNKRTIWNKNNLNLYLVHYKKKQFTLLWIEAILHFTRSKNKLRLVESILIEFLSNSSQNDILVCLTFKNSSKTNSTSSNFIATSQKSFSLILAFVSVALVYSTSRRLLFSKMIEYKASWDSFALFRFGGPNRSSSHEPGHLHFPSVASQ